MSVKVSVFIATSLDGYIARPDGDIMWLHEGEQIEGHDDAGYGVLFSAVDALVMGRGSFEKVLEFDSWPYGEKPVIVMSKRLQELPEHLPEVVMLNDKEPEAFLAELEEKGYEHIYLDGGQLIQSFLRAGLVDEMTITTIPVLLGAGIPLFGDLEEDIHWRLLATRSWANGFVQATYGVVR
ncbi:MAG TPA: dihydrofolate reductase family protein [Anaerolineae bacterium]|nr:dihydrofolate reductase family protein [Anaerolineae bacterium]